VDSPWQVQILKEARRDIQADDDNAQDDDSRRGGRQRYTEVPPLTALTPGSPADLPPRSTGLQHFLTTVLDREAFLRVLNDPAHPLLPEERTRIASTTGPHAAAFLTAFPTNAVYKQPWRRGHLLTALQLRVGLPITAITAMSVNGPVKCLCGATLAPDGAHCLACPHGGHPTARHNNVVNELCYIMHHARLNPKTEQHTHLRQTSTGQLSMAVADIVTAPADSLTPGQRIAVDVTVVPPIQSANNELGKGARRAEEAKTARYTAPIDGAAMTFVPFAIEHHGRFGTKALGLIDRISSMPTTLEYLADRGYTIFDNQGRPNRQVTSMHKMWAMQRLSTALMQGIAANVHDRLQQIVTAQIPAAARQPPYLHRMHFVGM